MLVLLAGIESLFNKYSTCDIYFKYEDDLVTAKSIRTSRH